MLKGVSQKVIEVVHTDNRYFEKAILFLRPGAPAEDKSSLKEQAGAYLSQIAYRPAPEPQPVQTGFQLADCWKIVGAALLGAGITCLFFLF